MTTRQILCFSGSVRGGSYNTRLAALVKRELALANVAVTQISLADYPLPLFNQDDEAEKGLPDGANKLFDLFCAHQGVFIAAPEYNASITPLLKNTIDWISRVRRQPPGAQSAFKGRVFALGAASPGGFGGYRGLMAVRHTLEIGLGAHVQPDQIAIPHCATAFADDGTLKDEVQMKRVQEILERLVQMADHYARG